MKVNYMYVRPSKAEKLQGMHNNHLVYRDTLTQITYDNAIILPAKQSHKMPFGLGGVLSREGEYIDDSGIDNRFGGYYEYKDKEYIDQKVVYCGYLVNHWGHFLIEAVTRLWYFFVNDTEVDKYVFVTNLDGDTSVTGNYKDFFELLGIWDKLEIINNPRQYREVIIPELSYKRGEYFSGNYNQIFDTITANALSRPQENIYCSKVFLSRRQFAQKTEIGLEMLDDFFLNNDFKVLYPEKISLTEMIHYLHYADICAAESGTLPHNFLFTAKEKQVMIIERSAHINEIQIDVDKIRDLFVTYIDGYYTIYPICKPPYYLAYSDCMSRFAKDYTLQPPSEKYFTEKYKRTSVAKYMKLYKIEHGYQWDINEWELAWAYSFYESYMDALNDIGKYLSGNKVFKGSQLFEIRRWKNFAKKCLR